jgi:hypothetical protein
MIVLYWQLVLSRSKLVDISGLPRAKVFRWFIFAIMIALILMEIVVSGLRGSNILGSLSVIATSIIYTICLALLSLWYFITAVRLLRLLRKVDSDTDHIRRLNRLIFASVAGAVIWITGIILISTPLYLSSAGNIVM